MTTLDLLNSLLRAGTVAQAEGAIDAFVAAHANAVRWVPVGGRENNRGSIEVSGDPGRAVVERLTNGIDAVLEAEHERHQGRPACRTPKEAAAAWLNVPDGGLSELTTRARQALADRVTLRLLPGEDRNLRTLEIRDQGIGITPQDMPKTILSLNESNKIQKHYLAGTYGQGGSSTFASSRYTLIASRRGSNHLVGFTVVRFLDLPPETFKTGHYVYLIVSDEIPVAEVPPTDFRAGTLVKHFGYDLSNYSSPVGPRSLYGLLNQVLFDPVLPIWLDNRVHNYRRVIKGSRNALNGAVDEGDEDRRGPSLSHNVRLFYVSLGDFGRIGIEYWVLAPPSKANKQPSAAFINPSRPIILTIDGQNHGELPSGLIKKQAELPYLANRLICHIDCNHLTPHAKRALFVSNREDARRGMVYELIQDELLRVLRSDDELTRLNNQARDEGRREQDESALKETRQEVARLLRLQGLNVAETAGAEVGRGNEPRGRPTHPRTSHPKPQQIELHEPPTFLQIIWDPEEPITFYKQQRRYIRIETDANSTYHNPHDQKTSRINIIIEGEGVALRGSTPLQGGRMRLVLEGLVDSTVGATGMIRVELARPGLHTLSDERSFRIVDAPPVKPSSRQVTLPPFRFQPVEGPDDNSWTLLDWPDNIDVVASAAQLENGELVIYYSTVFPKFASQRTIFERRNQALAVSFTKRYEIWLAVHSLLLYQEQQDRVAAAQRPTVDLDQEADEAREREERCRVATLAALFAAREVQLPPAEETD